MKSVPKELYIHQTIVEDDRIILLFGDSPSRERIEGSFQSWNRLQDHDSPYENTIDEHNGHRFYNRRRYRDIWVGIIYKEKNDGPILGEYLTKVVVPAFEKLVNKNDENYVKEMKDKLPILL